MFRLNFLTTLLCLVMDQPYMNYYFVPLVSFWFTALHLVLSLPPWRGDRSPVKTLLDAGDGVFRIAVLGALVALLSYPQVFDSVFESWPLRPFFQLAAEDGVREWRFRWMLDRFSILYGMVFALACRAWYHYRPGDAHCSFWPKNWVFTAVLGVVSMVCPGSYVMLLQVCDDKADCNFWHPYLTWIPISSYILFRHHNALFRTTFSPWMAWLGRISLELFVGQYHLFLANNTHAVLVLVPGQQLANALVPGLVLLCVADELNLITAAAQRMLLPVLGTTLPSKYSNPS